VRIAYSASLGGLPVDAEVSAVTLAGVKRLEAMGCIIEEAEPSLIGADHAFETLRALSMASQFGDLLKKRRTDFKDTAIWNIEAGLALGVDAIASAISQRVRLFQAMREFLLGYEFLLAPVSQVLPFAVDIDYPRSVAGQAMEHYLQWMRSCSRISITGHPAMSVPAGFTSGGLPVGLQVVGRWQNEFALLQLAHALERVDGIAQRRPPCATPS
jgi:amidase